MYFYKVIHLSLNRCVKKTANTEAWRSHTLHEESLTLCLLSVFKSPSAWFTQTVEIIIPFGYGISGEPVGVFLSLTSSYNCAMWRVHETVLEIQNLQLSCWRCPHPQAHSPSCRAEPTASGFINIKGDISRLVRRQYLQDPRVNLLL